MRENQKPIGYLEEKTMGGRQKIPAVKKMNRRAFLKALAASGGVAAYGTMLAGCGSAPASGGGGGGDGGDGSGGVEVTLDLTQPANQSLAATGGTLVLDANAVDSKGLLLFRSSETAVIAFSRKCTHMGCAVGEFQNGLASCPCHGSQFDTGGKPVKGPAQSPLKAYSATLSGSILAIKG